MVYIQIYECPNCHQQLKNPSITDLEWKDKGLLCPHCRTFFRPREIRKKGMNPNWGVFFYLFGLGFLYITFRWLGCWPD
jgi:DNA-directed RNA polymerase subunit RPC12/RpoP